MKIIKMFLFAVIACLTIAIIAIPNASANSAIQYVEISYNQPKFGDKLGDCVFSIKGSNPANSVYSEYISIKWYYSELDEHGGHGTYRSASESATFSSDNVYYAEIEICAYDDNVCCFDSSSYALVNSVKYEGINDDGFLASMEVTITPIEAEEGTYIEGATLATATTLSSGYYVITDSEGHPLSYESGATAGTLAAGTEVINLSSTKINSKYIWRRTPDALTSYDDPTANLIMGDTANSLAVSSETELGFSYDSALGLYCSTPLPYRNITAIDGAFTNAASNDATLKVYKVTMPSSGTIGTCPWSIDSEGTLSIGAGTLPNGVGASKAISWPWYFNKNITKVVIDENVVLGDSLNGMFCGLNAVTAIEGLDKLDTSNVTNMSYMFYYCQTLASADVSNFDTKNVTDMSHMFNHCGKLANIDVSNFKTSNVINMARMFNYCSKVEVLNVSNFDTSNVTDMSYMFNNCSTIKTLDVSKFNTSKVTNMSSMFQGCSNVLALDVSNFDTKNVTNMSNMFYNVKKITVLNVSNFNTSNVTDMSYMFYNLAKVKELDVSKFDTSNVTDMGNMFDCCFEIETVDVSNFKTSKVTNMSYMFHNCSNLKTLDLTNFETSNVTKMYQIFYGCTNLKSVDLTNFDTSNITTMDYMFYGCRTLNTLDLSNFDTSKVTKMNYMFYNCKALTTIYVSSSWTTAALSATASNMFGNASKIVGGAGTAYDSACVTDTYAHIDGGSENPGYFTAKYVIRYNANGGTGEMKSDRYPSGTKANLSANTFEREGYEFAGWVFIPTSTQFDFEDEQEVTLNSNITLYALWTEASSISDPQVSDFTFAAPENTTYSQDAMVPTLAPKGTIVGMGTITLKYATSITSEEWTATAPTYVGTYYVKACVEKSDKYNAAELTNENWKFTIEPKTITVTGTTVNDKAFDGTNVIDVTVGTPSGIFDGDKVIVTAVAATEDENAGLNKSVTIKYSLSGTDTGNYTISDETTTVTISQKLLTVTGSTADEKEYDGTTDAVTHIGTINGKIDGYNVTVTESGKFADANAANGKTVTISYTITGENKDNYTINDDTTTADITKKAVTVTAVDANKVYGDDDPTLTAIVTGTLGTDKVKYTVTRATGENANTYDINATGKASQGNYTVTFRKGTFTITQKEVTVKADDANKVYGDDDPTLTASVEGLVGTDKVAYTVERATGENADTYDINVTGDASQGNYAVTFEKGTFTITQKAVTVKADDATKVYGDDDPTLTATVTGTIGTDKVAYTVERATGENANTYDINVTGDASQGNYAVTFEKGTFTITQKAVTVKADDATKVFGDDDPTLTATVTGLVGTDKVAYTVERAAGENADTYDINVTGDASQGNYAVTFEKGTFTIVPKTVTIKANDATKVFGDPDPTLTATVIGTDDIDKLTYTVLKTAVNNVGSYDIIVTGDESQGNYTVIFEKGTFTITQRKITVIANDAAKVYGDADPTLNATVINIIGADKVNYTVERVDGENVGTYDINVTGDESQGNYLVSFENATFTINQKAVTVKACDAAKEYGADDPTLTATVAGIIGADKINYTVERVAGENYGSYDIKVTGKTSQGNYLVSFEKGTFTIAQKVITVIADDAAKVYGADDPTLTATIEGASGSNKITYTITRAAGEDKGTYEINVTGNATQGNYLVVFKNGTFTINQKAVTVKAANAAKVYGEDDPTLTASVEGTIGTDNVTYTVERVTGENVGTYDINVTGKTSQGNYLVSFEKASFTIAQKEVTIKAVDATKVYGDDDPTLTAEVEGTIGTDKVTYTVERATGEDAGTYDIKVTGDASQGNYAVTFEKGTFTITQKAVTVKALSVNKIYGDEDPGFSAVTEGTLNNEMLKYDIRRVKGENVGTYDINVTGEAVQGNYAVTFEKGTLTINQKLVTVTANTYKKAYGSTDPTFTATTEGLVGTDSITYEIQRLKGEDAGVYTIVVSGEKNQGNYAVEFINGLLTIEPAKDSPAKTDSDALSKVVNNYAVQYPNKSIVARLETSENVSNADVAKIQEVVGNKKLESFDATLFVSVDGQTINNAGSTNSTLITTVYTFDFSGKKNIQVFRAHEGVVEELSETKNADGEYVEYDKEAGTVSVSANKYSTYSIAYDNEVNVALIVILSVIGVAGIGLAAFFITKSKKNHSK